MSQMWHIVRKDLRRLRWVWLAWCAVVIADTAVRIIGAPVAFSGFAARQAVAQIATTLGLLNALLTVVLVSAVAHDEPLVGEDAFWITRPIERGSLMAAKVFLLGCGLIVLPLLSEITVMTAFSATRAEIVAAMPPLLLERATWASPLLAIAVLTRNLTRYVMTLAGVVAALAAIVTVTFTLLLMRDPEDISTASEVSLPDPTNGLVTGLTFILAIMVVVGYQYYRRRRGRAMVVAALALVAVAVLPDLWPWSLATAPPTLDVVTQDTAGIDVSVDMGSPPRLSDSFGPSFRATPTQAVHQVSARVAVSGIAGDIDARPLVRRATFTAPGLGSVGNSEGRTALVTLSGPVASPTIEAALGNMTVLTERALSPWDDWTSVLRLNDNQLATLAGQSGELDLELRVLLYRTVTVGAVALQSGSVSENRRHRFRNLGVIRRPNGCLVLLRVTHVAPLLAWPDDRQFSYVLVNRSRREAIEGGFAQDMTPRFALGVFGLMPAEDSTGFVVRELELQFPVRYGPETRSFTIDADWLADAELVLLEARPAGDVDRRISVRGFTIPAR